MSTRRVSKVEELIRMELSKLIQKHIPEDLGIVSVTRVYVTADLKTAKVFISAIFSDRQKGRLHIPKLVGRRFL